MEIKTLKNVSTRFQNFNAKNALHNIVQNLALSGVFVIFLVTYIFPTAQEDKKHAKFVMETFRMKFPFQISVIYSSFHAFPIDSYVYQYN